MASFNKVTLIGTLTRDVELKFTPKGTAVGKFSLAINRKWKTDSGEEREEVTYVECDSFGRQAENIAKFVGKGQSIFIEGRLKLDQWDDKQTGQKRSKLGVLVESCQFIDFRKRKEEGEDSGAPRRERPTQEDLPPGTRAASSADPSLPPPEDDDVPF